MLYAGALFESELSLAVGTADITVSLEISDLHMLSLEKITHRAENTEKAVVLIQPLGDIGGQRAEDRQSAQQQYDDHDDRIADKQVDHIQHCCDDPDESIQFIVSVTTLHEFSDFCQNITQNITVAFLYQ